MTVPELDGRLVMLLEIVPLLVPRVVFAQGRILPCERGFRVDVLLKKRPAQGYWA